MTPIACIVCCIPHPPRGARVRLWIARGHRTDDAHIRIPDTDAARGHPGAASRVRRERERTRTESAT
jgi:hypothetical protein